MITEEELAKMDHARHLLPPPGGEVVGMLIGEIRAIQQEVSLVRNEVEILRNLLDAKERP